jgi:biopolymer transport protein ExbB
MGGFFMFPIVIVLAVGLAIAVERWVHLKRVKDANKKTWDSVHQVLSKGEFDKAREMVNTDTSNMAQMLGMGLARQGAVRRREDIEIAR